MKAAISRTERRLLSVIWSYREIASIGWGVAGGPRAVAPRRRPGRYSKLTETGPRDSSSASKYSRAVKFMGPATSRAGKLWILVL